MGCHLLYVRMNPSSFPDARVTTLSYLIDTLLLSVGAVIGSSQSELTVPLNRILVRPDFGKLVGLPVLWFIILAHPVESSAASENVWPLAVDVGSKEGPFMVKQIRRHCHGMPVLH